MNKAKEANDAWWSCCTQHMKQARNMPEATAQSMYQCTITRLCVCVCVCVCVYVMEVGCSGGGTNSRFSLPRTGAQEMRQNSDKYMSLWFICGKKELITKISKSTETLRNIGRLSVTPCMYIWMEYLEKVLHVTYTHLFAQCTSFCVPGVTSETDHTLFIVLIWDICMRSVRQNPISHYLFIDDLVHFTQY